MSLRNYKYLLVALLTALLVAGFLTGSDRRVEAQQAPGAEPGYEPGEIIVKLEEDASPRDLAALNRRNEARIKENLPLPDASVVDLPTGLGVEEAVRRYEASPAVAYAEPNFILEPARTPNDPDFGKYQYALNNTG